MASSSDFELKFFDRTTGKQIRSPSELRDVKWASSTSPFGWGVQGIWPNSSTCASDPTERSTNVQHCALTPDRKMLISGDSKARLRLYAYPASLENNKSREYHGHSEAITNVAFSFDGRFAISVGGVDKSICQYEIKRPQMASASQASNT